MLEGSRVSDYGICVVEDLSGGQGKQGIGKTMLSMVPPARRGMITEPRFRMKQTRATSSINTAKRGAKGGTYRIPLPRQAIMIQRIRMKIFAINLYKGRTVEVDGQRRALGFLLV